jgi:hypothetical protein
MLDFAHRLTLQAVERGVAEQSPALDNLIACGFVHRAGPRDELALTDAGRRALAASSRSRLEAWGWTLIGVTVVALAIGVVVGWIVG